MRELALSQNDSEEPIQVQNTLIHVENEEDNEFGFLRSHMDNCTIKVGSSINTLYIHRSTMSTLTIKLGYTRKIVVGDYSIEHLILESDEPHKLRNVRLNSSHISKLTVYLNEPSDRNTSTLVIDLLKTMGLDRGATIGEVTIVNQSIKPKSVYFSTDGLHVWSPRDSNLPGNLIDRLILDNMTLSIRRDILVRLQSVEFKNGCKLDDAIDVLPDMVLNLTKGHKAPKSLRDYCLANLQEIRLSRENYTNGPAETVADHFENNPMVTFEGLYSIIHKIIFEHRLRLCTQEIIDLHPYIDIKPEEGYELVGKYPLKDDSTPRSMQVALEQFQMMQPQELIPIVLSLFNSGGSNVSLRGHLKDLAKFGLLFTKDSDNIYILRNPDKATSAINSYFGLVGGGEADPEHLVKRNLIENLFSLI